MLTVFMMMTTSGWMYVMYDGIYTTEINGSQDRNAHLGYGILFIITMVITSFFL